MDRGAWQAKVHRLTRDGHDLATKQPHTHTFTGSIPLENPNTKQKLNQTYCVSMYTHTHIYCF